MTTIAPPEPQSTTIRFYDTPLIFAYQDAFTLVVHTRVKRVAIGLVPLGLAAFIAGFYFAWLPVTHTRVILAVACFGLSLLFLATAFTAYRWLSKYGGYWRAKTYEVQDIPKLLTKRSIPREARARMAAIHEQYPTRRLIISHYLFDPIGGVELDDGGHYFVVYTRWGVIDPVEFVARH